MVIGKLFLMMTHRYLRDMKITLNPVIFQLSRNYVGIDYAPSSFSPVILIVLVYKKRSNKGLKGFSSKGFF